MEQFLATILLWPVNFAPVGWAFCSGQLMSISQNAALFSLLGVTYGGNGTSTFGLPNFNGRVPVGAGTAPGLSNYLLGQSSGVENVTLTISQIPAMTITINASNAQATASAPVAGTNTLAAIYDTINGNPIAGYNNAAPNTPLNPHTASPIGGSQPHSILQPYLVVNYIIALQGVFPSRS